MSRNYALFPHQIRYLALAVSLAALTACGGGSSESNDPVEVEVPPADPGPTPTDPNGQNDPNEPTALDDALRERLAELSLFAIDAANLDLPSINDPIPQLGKALFFAKNLGGEQSVACVSCHHPMLGGGDNLSLPVGVHAVDALGNDAHALLGIGRMSGVEGDPRPPVPRNSPSVLNLGLQDTNMFWDGRISRTPNGNIVTPDSPTNNNGNRIADPNLPADATLAAAQARFPVTSQEEMRGNFADGADNTDLRLQLTTRFDNSDGSFTSTWPQAFEVAFGDPDVTFDRIAQAIGEYQRSMVFVDSPWNAYLDGDNTALTEQQKEGAQLFYTARNQGGAGCVQCHNSNRFTDDRFHLTAFPQIGPGKGDDSGNGATHDFGREQVTGDPEDRYHFRTPSLLNVSVTAPYGHAGTYDSLAQVVGHYVNPGNQVQQLFGNNGDLCDLPQFEQLLAQSDLTCQALYPDAQANSSDVIDRLNSANDNEVEVTSALMPVGLNQNERAAIVAFLESLTDPCVEDRICLSPWIVDAQDEASFPDNNPLIAEDENGNDI